MKRFGAASLFAKLTASATGKVGELHIYDVIGKDFWGEGISASDVIQALKECEGATELVVRINSPGGSVWEGLAIHGLLKAFPAPKTVHVDGLAASMASLLAMVGDRIVTGKSALWMIHEPRTPRIERGTIEDHVKTADWLGKLRDGVCDMYCGRTKRARAEMLEWMAAETWMSAAEAKERGFTDEISEQAATGAAAAFTPAAVQVLSVFAKTPELVRAAAVASTAHPPPPAAPKEPVMLKFLIAALGLAETASEADVQAAITKRLESGRVAGEQLVALVAVTGKTTAEDAKGVIAGWKAGAEQVPALQAKVGELEKKAAGEKLEQLIAKGKADGKLSPGMEAWAKGQTAEALAAFLEVAPKLAPTREVKETKPPAGGAVEGSAAEIARQCGVSPEALSTFRENPNPTDTAATK
jgi:ATP-dependent protease ClpP protease subunit